MNVKISYVILDALNNIVSRYTPDFVTGLNGFGVSRNINVIDTEQRRLVTRIDPALGEVTLINWFSSEGDNAYLRSRTFKEWELDLITNDKTLAIEYNDGQETNYIVGVFKTIALSERSEGRFLGRPITFFPLTTWLKFNGEQPIEINMPSLGKTYPLTYPYRYGAKSITNNIIYNGFYKTIPLKAVVFGFMTSPIIIMLHHYDEKNKKDLGIYNKIQINGLSIPASDPTKPLTEREHLFINSDTMEILYWDLNEYTDVFGLRDPRFDSSLRAEPRTSLVNMVFNSGDTGGLVISRRQGTEL